MEIAPLSGPLGAEVWGLDLARGLNRVALAEVRAALGARKVLAFRDQELTPEQHIALTGSLGAVLRLPFIAPLADHPEIIALLKEAGERDIPTFGGTQHLAVNDYDGHRRLLHRTTVAGEVPLPAA